MVETPRSTGAIGPTNRSRIEIVADWLNPASDSDGAPYRQPPTRGRSAQFAPQFDVRRRWRVSGEMSAHQRVLQMSPTLPPTTCVPRRAGTLRRTCQTFDLFGGGARARPSHRATLQGAQTAMWPQTSQSPSQAIRTDSCQHPLLVVIENQPSARARCSTAQSNPQTLRAPVGHAPGIVCPAPRSIRVEEQPGRAAATMAGTEQGGKADKHDNLHNGFDRCALAVFKSNFRSGAFQNKTRDQTEFSDFSVKRPFQNETQLTPN